jgi:hypothetical protein
MIEDFWTYILRFFTDLFVIPGLLGYSILKYITGHFLLRSIDTMWHGNQNSLHRINNYKFYLCFRQTYKKNYQDPSGTQHRIRPCDTLQLRFRIPSSQPTNIFIATVYSSGRLYHIMLLYNDTEGLLKLSNPREINCERLSLSSECPLSALVGHDL